MVGYQKRSNSAMNEVTERENILMTYAHSFPMQPELNRRANHSKQKAIEIDGTYLVKTDRKTTFQGTGRVSQFYYSEWDRNQFWENFGWRMASSSPSKWLPLVIITTISGIILVWEHWCLRSGSQKKIQMTSCAYSPLKKPLPLKNKVSSGKVVFKKTEQRFYITSL